jgi:hypothetical protein
LESLNELVDHHVVVAVTVRVEDVELSTLNSIDVLLGIPELGDVQLLALACRCCIYSDIEDTVLCN